MGAAPGPGPGWEEGEFDFKLVFEEEPHRGPSPADPLTESPSDGAEGVQAQLDGHRDAGYEPHMKPPERHLPATQGNQPVGIRGLSPSANQRAGMHSPPPRRALVREFSGTYESLPARSVQLSESRVMDPSPASSPSSRGWLSPASSCDSLLVEEDDLGETAVHLVLSPSSRPTSPGGKKRRNTPLGSPCASRRGSYSSEEQHGRGPEGGDSAPPSQAPPLGCELSIPQKTRKTSLEQLSSREVDQEQAPGHSSPSPVPDAHHARREPPSLGMDYLSVPPALGWGRTRAGAHSPLFRSNALPPLDWPLPSQFDQYGLRMEVQPRPHHRAHYETEGSRGAVKAAPGGHPVVKLCGYTDRKPLSLQVFVGTADDRSIRPHPFYQIHRVTGKMVGTASQESVQAGTKLLDIPLSPESSMTALIDCAGILKLRNSDIELRKGETDVGRKNTRVRLVFRTHLPLAPPAGSPGRVLALQVASLPIECSQRSAQELPVIESGLLSVRVPAYSHPCVGRPVSVCLYVSNGKRKRSSTHCFKYIPVMFKEEDSLLSRPSVPPLDGLCPMEGSMDGTLRPLRGDPTSEETALGFHLPPYPSAYSSPPYPVAMGTHDEYFPKDDPGGDGRAPGGTLSECHPGFENPDPGFTEPLPPLYPHGRAGSPWPDSPYLSSSPSPSSSLSPFPASSPLSGSPLPPGPHFSSYGQRETCPSPPPLHAPPGRSYRDFYSPPPYSHYEGGWDPPQGRGPALGGGRWAEGEQAPFSSSSMHHITLEEVNEFIGEDIRSFQAECQMDNQPH
ncbi:hypothetical protein NHX12_004494 [Muraenolepis orangiensis]|uniref:RHD domain-containing protein n=1 Tax=Muraenolepis orangiensis TaxID=630683 RepID=A0A9Q0DXV6_9TELE|nr:hypothetical protein NHX12_004494 [Muraenolepis orangiensis]